MLRLCSAGLVLLLAAACRQAPESGPQEVAPAATQQAPAFALHGKDVGLDFIHFNGMSGAMYFPETMAPGVGLVDIDNDGDLDVYAVQGVMLGPRPQTAATYPPTSPLGDRLFRNDLVVDAKGRRTLHFTDITATSGIDIRSYGMGVAAGDVDNDGRIDIYRTGLSGSVLLRNTGNGTFHDVTTMSGTGNPGGWGVSASFLDYDRDGWLDLYVGNYLVYRVESDKACQGPTGQRDYCPPNVYRPQRDRLFHNRGDGTFEEVTSRALVGGADGAALGVSAADFDGDGWIDIYVGNDGTPNQLWINQQNGTFVDTALQAGAAISGSGNAEASMGIDAADYDNDGDEDLFVTNWVSQMNVLYVNAGGGVFEDRRAASGLGGPSVARTGFGTAWFDYDNDGWLDLLTVNGGVSRIESQVRAGDPFPVRMAKQLFRGSGNGRFEDVGRGDVFASLDVGRGAAFGDIDNDGDPDVVVANAAGPLQLLLNDVPVRHHWLGLRLMDAQGRRDMLGATALISRRDAPTLRRRARSDGSYASINDPRVLAGLGASDAVPQVTVLWPDGKREVWESVAIDRWTTLRQGSGRVLPDGSGK